MGRNTKIPDKVRIEKLTNRVRDLEDTIKRKDKDIRRLENRADLVVAIAGADNAERVRVISRYLDTLHTLSLLADANQAIRHDSPRISGSGRPPTFNPVPAWAANRLDQEIDDLHARTESLLTFVHRPHETQPARSRRSDRCATCGRQYGEPA